MHTFGISPITHLPYMQSEIHAHEVLGMMFASNKAYTRETLTAAIREQFGADSRFHTCSASNMTPEELVSFFEERGKLAPVQGGFVADPNGSCGH